MRFLETSLGIKRSETVLIVTDDGKIGIALAIEREAQKICENVSLLKMPILERHGQEPPRAVSAAMKSANVVIIPTTMSLSHTNARIGACRAGARVASMPGITERMLKEGGVKADYAKVKKTSDNVAGMLTGAGELHIKTRLGTDFTADISGRKGFSDSGIIKNKGDFGNLPAGEGFIAPVEGRSRGTLVFDGSFAGIGVLKSPMRVTVENGRAAKITGDRGKLRKMLTNGDNIGEVGIGTNPEARLIGNVLEDEKVMGTVHVAFGNNTGFGGKTDAKIHLDGIITEPDVWLDGKKVMEKGRFVSHSA